MFPSLSHYTSPPPPLLSLLSFPAHPLPDQLKPQLLHAETCLFIPSNVTITYCHEMHHATLPTLDS